MNNPKFHHLVPQVYMKQWCYENKKIYIIDKNNELKVESKDIENFGGIRQFHTIKAGMCCASEEDLKIIFNILDGYKVIHQEKELVSLEDYNSKYYDFDNWCILDNNKNEITRRKKNQIKHTIEQSKVLDIEELWDKQYESRWNGLLDIIHEKLEAYDNHHIDEFYKGFLMKWIVSLDWRGFETNKDFQDEFNKIVKITQMNKIEIQEKERTIKWCKDPSEEIRHDLLLKFFYEFLNDRGVIYNLAKSYIQNLNIVFLRSTDNIEFITSDNPSFTYVKDGIKNHIMPVTPKILICLAVDGITKNKYFTKHITDVEVRQYNKIIYDNARRYIITNNDSIEKLL